MTEKLKPIRSGKEGKFQCPFCGNQVTGTQEYYSSLNDILIRRFMKLLKESDDPSYQEAALDFIFSVFGPANPRVKAELECFGFLERFEERYDETKQDLRKLGKELCEVCRKHYDEWEITITFDSAHRARLICEDCYEKQKRPGEGDELQQAA